MVRKKCEDGLQDYTCSQEITRSLTTQAAMPTTSKSDRRIVPSLSNPPAQLDDLGNLELKAQNRVLGRLDVALRSNVLPVFHELVLLVAGLEAKLDDCRSC